MRAIVHIGMPKTGTTAIQSWLHLNAAEIRRQGLFYDRIAMPGVTQYVAHVELHLAQLTERGHLVNSRQTRATYGIETFEDQARVADTFARRLDAALAGAGDAHTAIFSSEQVGATTRTPIKARALHSWLDRRFDDIRYVVYVRRQEDWLPSNWVETLRRGQSHNLLDFVRANMEKNYARIARIWTAAGGRGSVIVRPFEPEALADGDVVTDFARICGIDPTKTTLPPRVHESLGIAGAEVLRALNAVLPRFEGSTKNPLSEAVRNALDAMPDTGPRIVLSDTLRDEIRAANADTNARLLKRHLGGQGPLFPRQARGAGTMIAAPEDIDRILHDLRRRLGRRIDPHIDRAFPAGLAPARIVAGGS